MSCIRLVIPDIIQRFVRVIKLLFCAIWMVSCSRVVVIRVITVFYITNFETAFVFDAEIVCANYLPAPVFVIYFDVWMPSSVFMIYEYLSAYQFNARVKLTIHAWTNIALIRRIRPQRKPVIGMIEYIESSDDSHQLLTILIKT